MSKEKKVKKEKVAKEPKGPTIRSIVEEHIMDGLTFAESKAKIDKEFPDNKHSKACFYWYRNKLSKAGKNVPELVREKKAPKEKKTKAAA